MAKPYPQEFRDDVVRVAAPQVTGVAALMLSVAPAMSAAELKNCIVAASVSHGEPVPGQPFSTVNAAAAVECAQNGGPPPAPWIGDLGVTGQFMEEQLGITSTEDVLCTIGAQNAEGDVAQTGVVEGDSNLGFGVDSDAGTKFRAFAKCNYFFSDGAGHPEYLQWTWRDESDNYNLGHCGPFTERARTYYEQYFPAATNRLCNRENNMRLVEHVVYANDFGTETSGSFSVEAEISHFDVNHGVCENHPVTNGYFGHHNHLSGCDSWEFTPDAMYAQFVQNLNKVFVFDENSTNTSVARNIHIESLHFGVNSIADIPSPRAHDSFTSPVDVDGDGFSVERECDDNDPAINPGAADTSDDGVDQNCDGGNGPLRPWTGDQGVIGAFMAEELVMTSKDHVLCTVGAADSEGSIGDTGVIEGEFANTPASTAGPTFTAYAKCNYFFPDGVGHPEYLQWTWRDEANSYNLGHCGGFTSRAHNYVAQYLPTDYSRRCSFDNMQLVEHVIHANDFGTETSGSFSVVAEIDHFDVNHGTCGPHSSASFYAGHHNHEAGCDTWEFTPEAFYAYFNENLNFVWPFNENDPTVNGTAKRIQIESLHFGAGSVDDIPWPRAHETFTNP